MIAPMIVGRSSWIQKEFEVDIHVHLIVGGGWVVGGDAERKYVCEFCVVEYSSMRRI